MEDHSIIFTWKISNCYAWLKEGTCSIARNDSETISILIHSLQNSWKGGISFNSWADSAVWIVTWLMSFSEIWKWLISQSQWCVIVIVTPASCLLRAKWLCHTECSTPASLATEMCCPQVSPQVRRQLTHGINSWPSRVTSAHLSWTSFSSRK